MQIWVRGVGVLPGFFFLFYLFLSIVTAVEQNSTEYVDPTQNPNSNYSKVTCDFSRDSCGWKNVGGNRYPLTWRKVSDYMHLDMDNAGKNRKGRLSSPWLEPLELGYHSCQLSFRYYIRSSSYLDCQLSLFRQTWSDAEELIWVTKKPTGILSFSSPITNKINCTGEEFRMVFEGKGSCYVRWYNEIDVMDIHLTVELQNVSPATSVITPPGSGEEGSFTIEHTYTGTLDDMLTDDATTDDAATTAATTTTTVSFSPGASTDRSVKDKDDDDNKRSGLDAGVTAGIIIAIIIVVVVLVALFIVVIIFFRRRRQTDKAMKNSIKRNMSRAVTNSMYMHNEVETIGNNGAAATAPHPSRTLSETDHHYESADLHPPLTIPSAPPTDDNHHYDIPNDSDPFPPHTIPDPHGSQLPLHTTVLNKNRNYDHPNPTLDASPTVDKHDYTNTAPVAAAAGTYNAYDHTNGASRPAVVVTEGDNYNHLDPRHNAMSDTRPYQNAGNEYIDMEAGPGHSASQHYTEPDPAAILAPNHPRNTDNPTNGISAQAQSTDYELVGGGVVEEMRSRQGDDGGYHCLDVTGERKGERVVGENAYDHAKGDDYDSLHHENRRRQQRGQLSQNDYYSHV